MRIHVIHRDRAWKPPANHLDGRRCPDCGATCHGWTGQRKHQEWHDRIDQIIIELAKRTGIAEEQIDMPWTWTAQVEGEEREQLAVPDGL